jgi:hypothetical protein
LRLSLCGAATGLLWSSANNPAPASAGALLHFQPYTVVAKPPTAALEELLADSLFGRSGKLRARFIPAQFIGFFPAVSAALGTSPGVVSVVMPRDKSVFSFVSMVPFVEKRGERVGNYLVGYWPAELRRVTDEEYENPAGFVRVTAANEMTRVSEHFLLRDFVTHDNQSWPKYVVLQEPLLDKLELVFADLEKRGTAVEHVRVLSGFRTPFHNMHGLGSEGGARDSRHQYGDAADIIIDNDRDGRMDDLNRDRVVDSRDLEIVLAAVERVERAYPELVGGLGRYQATGPSGPYAHVDVRGYRARWDNDVRRTTIASGTSPSGYEAQKTGQAVKVSRCNVSAELAVLCGGR